MFLPQSFEMLMNHQLILSWFADDPRAPFSLHHFVQAGLRTGKVAGEWYGPSCVSHMMSDLVSKNQSLANLVVYVAQDCCVAKDEVWNLAAPKTSPTRVRTPSKECSLDLPGHSSILEREEVRESPVCPSLAHEHALLTPPNSCDRQNSLPDDFSMMVEHSSTQTSPPPYMDVNLDRTTRKEPNEWDRNVLIVVPLRLGSDKLNPVYIPAIKGALSLPYCTGIMGGKPKHSLYIIGWHENSLIYLDPHYCQNAFTLSDEMIPMRSFHCCHPRKTSVSNMDSSCAIGFLLKHSSDFDVLKKDLQTIMETGGKGSFALFSIEDKRPSINHISIRTVQGSRELIETHPES